MLILNQRAFQPSYFYTTSSTCEKIAVSLPCDLQYLPSAALGDGVPDPGLRITVGTWHRSGTVEPFSSP